MSQADVEAPEAALPPPPKRGGVLPIILGVLNLGTAAFIALRVLHAPAACGPAAEAATHKEDKAQEGPIVQLDAFVVNLNEPGSNRYLKVNFELELANPKALDEFTRVKRALRDDVLRYLSGLSVAQTQGEESKSKIQGEIVARADKEVGASSVRRLYFTEFVVQ